MKYPAFNVKGPCTVQDLFEFRDIAHKIHLNSLPTEVPFCIDGVAQTTYQGYTEGLRIVSIKEAIKIYKEFSSQLDSFIASLKPGAKVIVEPIRIDPDCYPCSFIKDMTYYCGKTVTIKDTWEASGEAYKRRRFYNGDDKFYTIEEERLVYSWHSSMFELGILNASAPISLHDINVDITKL